MKNLVIALSVFLAVNTLATAQTSSKPSKEEVQKTTYSCPMHPKEIGKQGDNCSKCGMALTKSETPKPTYACPMHPDQTSMKEGTCGKCGMKLVKTTKMKHDPKVKGSQSSTVVETKYACPMHPKVTGKKGDDCSKCGMALTKVDEDKNK
jgi:hypothetical protein